MRILTIVIMMLFGIVVNAQVPGYLGKRILLDVDYQFFNQLNRNIRPEFHTELNFNDKISFGLSYIITRKLTLGAKFSTYNDEFNTTLYGTKNENIRLYNTTNDSYYWSDETLYLLPSGEKSQLSVNQLDFTFKKVLSKHLAPLGFFHGVGIGIIQYTISPYKNDANGYYIIGYDYPDKEMAYTQKKEVAYESTKMINSNYGIGLNLSYSIGSQMIIYDYIILKAAMNFNVPFFGFSNYNSKLIYGYTGNFDVESSDFITPQNYYSTLATNRIIARNLCYFNIGIGIVIR